MAEMQKRIFPELNHVVPVKKDFLRKVYSGCKIKKQERDIHVLAFYSCDPAGMSNID